MRLMLIDAGNSRVKWAVRDGAAWREQGAVDTAQTADLAAQWQTVPAVDRIVFCCVANDGVAAALTSGAQDAFGVAPLRFRSRPQIDRFSNGYEDPGRLGADRLAAALGAWHRCRKDLVVVMAGTAVTVDMVAAEGRFLGGLILPGARLMRAALHLGTAALPDAGGQARDMPGNTADAITTGVLDALAGAVDRARARMTRCTGRRPELVLSGGDADLLQPLLPDACAIPNLVLEGLLAAAPHLD